MKLTNDEIFKVVAMYWGCECSVPKIHSKNNKREISETDRWIQTSWLNTDTEVDIHLLLTPLAKITDEHAIKVAKINGVRTDNPLLVGKSMIHWLAEKGTNRDVNFEVYQQLILWGYAIPLWFGIDHWANGKTAIELEVAIDKTLKPITS